MTSTERSAPAGIRVPGQSEPRIRTFIHVLQQPGERQPTHQIDHIISFVNRTFHTSHPPVLFSYMGESRCIQMKVTCDMQRL